MNDTNDAGTTAGAAPAANSNAEAETAARVAALEAELADHKDRLLRALAEVENIRRRAERERAEAVKYAVTGFAKDLLAVADNLRRALDSMPEAEIADGRTRSLLDGVAATERELLAAFEGMGCAASTPRGSASTTICTRRCLRPSGPISPAASSSKCCSRVMCCTIGCCARRWSGCRSGRRRPRPICRRARPSRCSRPAARLYTAQSQGMTDQPLPGDRAGASPGPPGPALTTRCP